MGCTTSKPAQSSRPPFFSPLPHAAPFSPTRDTAERALNAQIGWREKRANLPRDWSSYPDEANPIKEVHQANGWSKDKGVIEREATDVPKLRDAPATGEQARQWKVRARGVRHELDVTP